MRSIVPLWAKVGQGFSQVMCILCHFCCFDLIPIIPPRARWKKQWGSGPLTEGSETVLDVDPLQN